MLPIPKLPVQSEKAHYRLVMGFVMQSAGHNPGGGTANLM